MHLQRSLQPPRSFYNRQFSACILNPVRFLPFKTSRRVHVCFRLRKHKNFVAVRCYVEPLGFAARTDFLAHQKIWRTHIRMTVCPERKRQAVSVTINSFLFHHQSETDVSPSGAVGMSVVNLSAQCCELLTRDPPTAASQHMVARFKRSIPHKLPYISA